MRHFVRTPTAQGLFSAGLVSLIGVLLFVPNVSRLVTGDGPAPELILAAVGTVLSAVLILAGYLLLRDGTTAAHVPRITGWAVLGTVLLGLILALIDLSNAEIPLFAAATLLSVSTFAHIIIGVRDVQRIRAEELAQQREKLAVLNRLVRHNLRHEAQYLLGAKSMIAGAKEPDEHAETASDIGAIADRLTEMHDTLDRTQEIIRRNDRSNTAVDLGDVVEDVVSTYRCSNPEATITIDVPDIRITAREQNGRVRLTVADNGPGIPEPDRSVVTREADIDQMTHAQGLGLWFVRWAMDAYDGDFDLETNDSGTIVGLGFNSV